MHSKRGFSLIELAIVVVIIGFVMSAVVYGYSMVRGAENRAVIAETDRYMTAMKVFFDKYNQLPGDFTKATTMWGTDGACTSTFSATPKKVTCNGNGDGTIGSCCPVAQTNEWYRAWQHLANAELVDGSFSGTNAYATPMQVKGTVIPKSVFPGGAYTLMYSVNYTLSAEEFIYDPREMLVVGDIAAACNGSSDPYDCITRQPLFRPVEAAEIDTKVDDGMPATGRVMARPSTSVINPNCTTTATLTSLYKVSYTDKACSLAFDTGY